MPDVAVTLLWLYSLVLRRNRKNPWIVRQRKCNYCSHAQKRLILYFRHGLKIILLASRVKISHKNHSHKTWDRVTLMRKNSRISSYQEDCRRIFSLKKKHKSKKKKTYININPDRLHNRREKFINSISEPEELALTNFDSFFTKLSAK